MLQNFNTMDDILKILKENQEYLEKKPELAGAINKLLEKKNSQIN